MAEAKLFSIGEVAKLFHVSVSSLRHYEAAGLLQPEYISPDSGYRHYSTRQFEVLNTLRYLRALGMPLHEIADFLQNRNLDSIEQKLCQQKAAVAEKQRELSRIERKIDRRLRQLQSAKTAELDKIELVVCPACRLVWVEDALNIRGFLDMEAPIRRLEQAQPEAVVFLGKVGLGISEAHLRQGLLPGMTASSLRSTKKTASWAKRTSFRKCGASVSAFAAATRRQPAPMRVFLRISGKTALRSAAFRARLR